MSGIIGYEFDDDGAEYHYIVTKDDNIIHPKDIIQALEKLRLLSIEAESAIQTLWNLANGELAGDAARVARNAAINLERVLLWGEK